MIVLYEGIDFSSTLSQAKLRSLICLRPLFQTWHLLASALFQLLKSFFSKLFAFIVFNGNAVSEALPWWFKKLLRMGMSSGTC